MSAQEDNKEEFIERIKRWYEYSEKFKDSNSNIDISTRFLYLWISFNALFNLYCENLDDSEFKKISQTMDILFKNNKFKLNSEIFFTKNIGGFDQLLSEKVVNIKNELLGKEQDWKIYDKNYFKTNNIIEKIKIGFGVINRIRNNLIHGSKGSLRNAEKDSRLLFASNVILSDFLGIIIKNNTYYK